MSNASNVILMEFNPHSHYTSLSLLMLDSTYHKRMKNKRFYLGIQQLECGVFAKKKKNDVFDIYLYNW